MSSNDFFEELVTEEINFRLQEISDSLKEDLAEEQFAFLFFETIQQEYDYDI